MLNIITDLRGDKFKVTIIHSKTLVKLFEYIFVVYSGFDKNGLINDTIFMYKQN